MAGYDSEGVTASLPSEIEDALQRTRSALARMQTSAEGAEKIKANSAFVSLTFVDGYGPKSYTYMLEQTLEARTALLGGPGVTDSLPPDSSVVADKALETLDGLAELLWGYLQRKMYHPT